MVRSLGYWGPNFSEILHFPRLSQSAVTAVFRGLSLKDTQYALDMAARFMAEDSKPTPTPAKTYRQGQRT